MCCMNTIVYLELSSFAAMPSETQSQWSMGSGSVWPSDFITHCSSGPLRWHRYKYYINTDPRCIRAAEEAIALGSSSGPSDILALDLSDQDKTGSSMVPGHQQSLRLCPWHQISLWRLAVTVLRLQLSRCLQ